MERSILYYNSKNLYLKPKIVQWLIALLGIPGAMKS